jgi:hypothetical protein
MDPSYYAIIWEIPENRSAAHAGETVAPRVNSSRLVANSTKQEPTHCSTSSVSPHYIFEPLPRSEVIRNIAADLSPEPLLLYQTFNQQRCFLCRNFTCDLHRHNECSHTIPMWKLVMQEKQVEDSGVNFRMLQFQVEKGDYSYNPKQMKTDRVVSV